MSTEKTATEVVAAAIPTPKAPVIDKAAIDAARSLLARAAELEREKNAIDPKGWGPGKPGKRLCNMTPVPPQLGKLTINYNEELTDRDGKKFNRIIVRVVEGKMDLTWDEFAEYEHRIDRLKRSELEGRLGKGKAKSIMSVYDVNRGAWISSAADGRHAGPDEFF